MKKKTNPFVHINEGNSLKQKKEVSNAFLHPGDEGYDNSPKNNKKPLIKPFLHDGDEGYERALQNIDFETLLEKANFAKSNAEDTKSKSKATKTTSVTGVNGSEENKAYVLSKRIITDFDCRRCSEKIAFRNGNIHELLTDKGLERFIFGYLENHAPGFKSNLIKEIKYFLETDGSIRTEQTSSTDFVAFTNGVVLDNQLRSVIPNRELFLTHQIKAAYNPALIGKCPVMIKFIESSMGGNIVLMHRTWQAIAFVLANASAKRFLVLEGIGDSGKSQLIGLIEAFFPDDCFPLKLEEFNQKFLLDRISGKKLVTCADLPKSVLSETAVGNIKAITGGDKINGQAKFGTPYTLDTGGGQRLIFATNHPIILREVDEAFANRIVYLPFINAVPPENRDPNLLSKLISEKDAIVSTALQYLPELIRNNFTFAGEAETQTMLATYSATANVSAMDILRKFLSDNLVCAEEFFTATEDIRQAFMTETGIVIDTSNFGKLLKTVLNGLYPNAEEKRITTHGVKNRGYNGIKIKEDN